MDAVVMSYFNYKELEFREILVNKARPLELGRKEVKGWLSLWKEVGPLVK